MQPPGDRSGRSRFAEQAACPGGGESIFSGVARGAGRIHFLALPAGMCHRRVTCDGNGRHAVAVDACCRGGRASGIGRRPAGA